MGDGEFLLEVDDRCEQSLGVGRVEVGCVLEVLRGEEVGVVIGEGGCGARGRERATTETVEGCEGDSDIGRGGRESREEEVKVTGAWLGVACGGAVEESTPLSEEGGDAGECDALRG